MKHNFNGRDKATGVLSSKAKLISRTRRFFGFIFQERRTKEKDAGLIGSLVRREMGSKYFRSVSCVWVLSAAKWNIPLKQPCYDWLYLSRLLALDSGGGKAVRGTVF